jgi:hypothetical protein
MEAVPLDASREASTLGQASSVYAVPGFEEAGVDLLTDLYI